MQISGETPLTEIAERKVSFASVLRVSVEGRRELCSTSSAKAKRIVYSVELFCGVHPRDGAVNWGQISPSPLVF